MVIEKALADIEASTTLVALKDQLNGIAQDLGFSGFGFVDAGRVGRGETPFYIGTAGARWEQEYVRNGFVNVDPCLQRARRTNTPFVWSDVPVPPPVGRKTPGAAKTMDAARDHGFRDGLVIPFHFRDSTGLYHSTSAVFFWKDRIDRFRPALRGRQHLLHVIMIYWAQRSLDIIKRDIRADLPLTTCERPPHVSLSDRERDVLAWAAAGYTVVETAQKLNLGKDTVETHIRNAMRKLGASNKTHATALALYYGLIDL